MKLQEFRNFISGVEGLCSEDDCFLLYSLVKDLKAEGDILDIGSFKGRVSVAFAKAIKDSGQKGCVYALESDFFGSRGELLRNISAFGMGKTIYPVFRHSSLAHRGWQKKLKFIWVDTDGNFFSGKCDFLLWEPHLVEGGIIAFSCAKSLKIQRVVKECIAASGRFLEAERSGDIVYARKIKSGKPYPKAKMMRLVSLYYLHYNIRKILYDLRCIFLPYSAGKDSLIKKLVNKLFERIL
jgi:hypothetical protein